MAPEEGLELDRPRDLGALLTLALSLFFRHFSLFFTPALIVVAPYVLLVDGVWGRQLADGPDADAPPGATITSLAAGLLVAQPLITAMHARVVLALNEGRVPTVGQALRLGLAVFLPAAGVVVLFTIGVLAGFLALILPGIYLSTRWYFGPQAVAVDGLRGPAALRRSAEAVEGQWWSTFGRLIAVGLMAGLVGLVVGGLLQAIGAGADSPPLFVAGSALGQAAGAAFGALAGTLLFFDRRARRP